jgi:hypothetical protein
MSVGGKLGHHDGLRDVGGYAGVGVDDVDRDEDVNVGVLW